MSSVSNSVTTQSQNCYIKSFIVIVVALSAIAMTAGVVSFLASRATLPSVLRAVSRLKAIGVTNSYLMMCGGGALFVLGVIAWAKVHSVESSTHESPSKQE